MERAILDGVWTYGKCTVHEEKAAVCYCAARAVMAVNTQPGNTVTPQCLYFAQYYFPLCHSIQPRLGFKIDINITINTVMIHCTYQFFISRLTRVKFGVPTTNLYTIQNGVVRLWNVTKNNHGKSRLTLIDLATINQTTHVQCLHCNFTRFSFSTCVYT